MNLFQRANLSAAFFVLTFLVTGIAFSASDINRDGLPRAGDPYLYSFLESHVDTILLSFFIVVFRIKILLDDHRHFGDARQDQLNSRFFGFMLAVFSWIFWGLSALDIKNLHQSAEVLLYAIAISSIWIVVHWIEERSIGLTEDFFNRFGWICFNFICMIFLSTVCGFLAVPFNTTFILAVLILVLIVDIILSNPYKGVLG